MNLTLSSIKDQLPLDQIQALLDKDPENNESLYTHTGKYIAKLDLYLSEKIKIAQHLGLDESRDLKILDIGSGAGFFPWICKNLGHIAKSSYYDDFLFYRDMWQLLRIDDPFFLDVLQDWKMPNDTQYDVIVSMRTVFDRIPTSWKDQDWIRFMEQAMPYLADGGRLFIKSNFYNDSRDPNLDMDPSAVKLFEPYMIDGYNSRVFCVSKDDIRELIGKNK